MSVLTGGFEGLSAGDVSPRLSVVVPATNEPPTLARAVGAIERAAGEREEIIVVREPRFAGPAEARNRGADRASGDVLVFVDADVEVHADALERIREAFSSNPDLTAVFGSYDDRPAAPGVASAFRNLLHHHVHHTSAGAASTFWTGLGAVRRDAFLAVGGFDAARLAIEDIELGMRLADRGGRIVLDPTIQGTHLKRWTLRRMVCTDFLVRGVPWVRLLLTRRSTRTTLNLGWRHRLSTLASIGAPVALVLGELLPALVFALVLIVLNRAFYSLLLRRRGPLEAAAGVLLHAVHHMTAAASLVAGIVAVGLAPTLAAARRGSRSFLPLRPREEANT